MMSRSAVTAFVLLSLLLFGPVRAQTPSAPPLGLFFEAASSDERLSKAALDQLEAVWRDHYAALIIDLARLMRPPARQAGASAGAEEMVVDDDVGGGDVGGGRGRDFGAPSRPHPSTITRSRLVGFLEKRTGKRFGHDLARWRDWMWALPYEPHPDYAAFKGALYGRLDPKMAAFFPPGVKSLIRLDEVDWGGVPVNGIPPLVYPKHIAAGAASYLKDNHVVFGIEANGEARAYPKRILAWHELARDRLGQVELTIVYCTLCGTVIPFESEVAGKVLTFGTSGLLYQSNKLMFDEQSSSLWSSLEGRPVIGPLAGTEAQLRSHPVVTTTWGEWRALHPDTTVLSIDTGHERDYSEGAAYRDYFSTDRLMFNVSRTDDRLKNKAEVLVMRLSAPGAADTPVAIAIDFLKRRPIYQTNVAGRDLVVVTSPEGANRVYEAAGRQFAKLAAPSRVTDKDGRTWTVTEEALVAEFEPGTRLPRVVAQRAFWFGWYAQFPKTILIK